ncbi:TPA: acyltransferase family protein [Serratia marcescens]
MRKNLGYLMAKQQDMLVRERLFYLDIARAFAIFTVFLAHVYSEQLPGSYISKILFLFSPSVPMAMLAIVSAVLITPSFLKCTGDYLSRRFVRIYTPLLICLGITFAISRINNPWGYDSTHILLHSLGLSLFFELFNVQNNAGIGYGLWFITTILIMYVTIPMQVTLFKNKHSWLYLLILIALSTLLGLGFNTLADFPSVFSGFFIGVYLTVNNSYEKTLNIKISYLLILLIIGIAINYSPINIHGKWIKDLTSGVIALMMLALFYKMQKLTPYYIAKSITFFSLISYEFYMLHFSFINEPLKRILGITGITNQLAVSLAILIPLSFITHKFGMILINKTRSKTYNSN